MAKALIRILTRDARGRPKSCEIMHDDEVANLQGGEHFLIAEIDADTLDPKRAERRRHELALVRGHKEARKS
jgi:hypothetical protein